MATKKISTGAIVREESLGDYGTRAMGTYAEEVNLGRAVPDLMDGLKPVQRRVMWAASLLGKDFVKTARVVGDCFAAGTKVTLESGAQLAIEDLVVGDMVATDTGPEPVVELYLLPDKELYEVQTDIGVVQATADQVFYCGLTDEVEFERTLLTLKPGDRIVSFGTTTATVLDVKKLPDFHTVYDIQVANRHRFYANNLLVHNCIGRYHPHGDQSVAGAITTMMHCNVPPLAGKGNWGSLIDPAAAMRYTNCTLSNYGWSFFQSDYISKDVTSFVPNYDDTTVEPVSLPALMPNVLLNGGEGIGVGTTTCLPTFTPESTAAMMAALLKGEKCDLLKFAKTLKYANRYGGKLVNTKENRQAWLSMFKTSQASVQFEATLTIDRDNKAIEIDDWPQGLNPLKFITKVRLYPEVASADNHKGATGFRIEMRKDHNFSQFDKLVEKVQKATQVRRSFKINVTHRQAQIEDGIVKFETRFLSLSVPQLLVTWLRERVALEKRSLVYRIAKQQVAIDYSKLLIFASTKIDQIIKIVRNSTRPKDDLMKALGLTELQAVQILDLQLKNISKLDQDAIKVKLKNQQEHLKQLNSWLAKPKLKVLADTTDVLTAIQKDKKFEADKDRKMTVS